MTPVLIGALYCCLNTVACQTDRLALDADALQNYAQRMSVTSSLVSAEEQLPTVPETRPAQPLGPVEAARAPTFEEIQAEVPDPDAERENAARAIREPRNEPDKVKWQRVLERLETVRRPRRINLTLEDALHRALAGSYAIRVEGYNPAVNTTRVVEAEAAFDATFFVNLTKNKQNQPSASQITGSNVDTLNLEGGFRKLLPTGMQAQMSLGYNRISNDLSFQTINPAHFSQFVTEFRQPLLRGFGIDFNRAQIRIARNDRRVSVQVFEQQVRDTLNNVEQAYWRLVQARREVVISARLLAEFQQIYDFLFRRQDFDAFRIQISDTRARLESSKAEFVRVQNNVRNAEDRLIALMNDPEINLAADLEIVPTDFPSRAPLVIDRFSEVQTALDNRSEIRQAKLRIENARLFVGVAENQALPRLDLTFRYSVDGLGVSADDSFDEVTKNNFTEYFVGVEFELPVGNRARRAAWRRAQLQWAQAIAALKQTFEAVILDTNVAIRDLTTAYDQIDPNYQSARANDDQIQSIIRRAERRDFPQLSQELSAHQSLAASRRDLLGSMVDYNIAIITLERAKGTLLRYYNVVLPDEGSSATSETLAPLPPVSPRDGSLP